MTLLVVLAGLPGSGKSLLARGVAGHPAGHVVHIVTELPLRAAPL